MSLLISAFQLCGGKSTYWCGFVVTLQPRGCSFVPAGYPEAFFFQFKMRCLKKKRFPALPLTLANILSLELGSLDVVTMSLGSSTPAHLYSSSMCELTPVHNTTQILLLLKGYNWYNHKHYKHVLTLTFCSFIIVLDKFLQLQSFTTQLSGENVIFCKPIWFLRKHDRDTVEMQTRGKWREELYPRVPSWLSAFSARWFGDSSPGPSCTSTPAGVSPLCEAAILSQ